MKRKKATGLDVLPLGLKDIAKGISKPLTHVINLSLKSGVVPSKFKLSKVKPLFKSGNTQNIDNYRPISILSSISKILEKCVHSQVLKYLENNSMISSKQFGFRQQRSTELAATLFVDSIRKNMDNGLYTGAIYIDLSKAFDTIGHASILNKLPEYGIEGNELSWFTNYLFERKQCVYLNDTFSKVNPVFCGVPQGSILGPLLFILHFNDIAKSVRKCEILKYADDTVLFVAGKNIDIIETLLNEDFQNVCCWMKNNELIVNMKKGKTEYMVFGTSKKLNKLEDRPMNISFQGMCVSFTNCYKYLGLQLSSSLNMSDHFQATYKKASSRLHLLNKITQFTTSSTRSIIYKSMIQPTLTYCPLITSCTTKTFDSTLSRLQKRAERIIGENITSIESIKKRRVCCFVFKCIKNDVCGNFENYFEIMDNKTRNSGILCRLPKVRLEIAKKSFYFNGAKVFNDLPRNIRESNSYCHFKRLIDIHF